MFQKYLLSKKERRHRIGLKTKYLFQYWLVKVTKLRHEVRHEYNISNKVIGILLKRILFIKNTFFIFSYNFYVVIQ